MGVGASLNPFGKKGEKKNRVQEEEEEKKPFTLLCQKRKPDESMGELFGSGEKTTG